MSLTNPLVTDLKAWTLRLMESGAEIDDKNCDLAEFCGCLERCFQFGVSTRLNSFGFPRMPEAWYWIEEFAREHDRSLFAFVSSVDLVRKNEQTRTLSGKLRLFIRLGLMHKFLYFPVETLVRTSGLALAYYSIDSIIGDEIIGEIFLSVLLQIGTMNFRLDLRNTRFLDDSWKLPDYSILELVPCKTLGITVRFFRDKALVVSLDPSSVAAEDDKIVVGDVLDELNNNVITSKNRGAMNKILKKSAGLPVSLRVVKARLSSGKLYEPIANLLRISGLAIDIENRPISPPSDSELVPRSNRAFDNTAAGYSVEYCGYEFTGAQGDVNQIERAILRLLRCNELPARIPVRFECLELGIRITSQSDESILFHPSYMDISSCGRTSNIPNYFAYIAGNTNCSVATKFCAFIFHHPRENEVALILQSLDQGFHRTHFAV